MKQAPRAQDEKLKLQLKEKSRKRGERANGVNFAESENLVRQVAQRLRPEMLFSSLCWILSIVEQVARATPSLGIAPWECPAWLVKNTEIAKADPL